MKTLKYNHVIKFSRFYLLFSLASFITFTQIGCKKLVEVDSPNTAISTKSAYNNDATAIGVITSLYTNLSSGNALYGGELNAISLITGLSSDELTLFNGINRPLLSKYYSNSLTSLDNIPFWSITYNRLFTVNTAIETLPVATGLTPTVKQQLLGEAKFMRGFYYFYLINLYGDIPLILSTDYSINAIVGKSSKASIYKQIITDLIDAQNLLNDKYLKADGITPYPYGVEERVRPTKWAAAALLARVYLYISDWSNAEKQSTLVIENSAQYQMETLDRVFLKNNKEAIWQIQPVIRGSNAGESTFFLLPPSGPSVAYPVYLSQGLINSFENGDQRNVKWVNSVTINGIKYYYPYKYKIATSSSLNISVNEYTTVLRLSEQFLIRAEARAQQNKLNNAINDVDIIRKRAQLALIKDINPNLNRLDLLDVILKEKRVEYFSEWGHRWFDLKRTGKIDGVMQQVTPIKSIGGAWESYQKDYPIDYNEVRVNPNLSQNQGY